MVVTPDGLRPASPDVAGKLRKFGDGEIVSCEIKESRNYGLLKKYHKMMRMAYDWWSEANPAREVGGHQVAPNYKQFRRDVTVQAGYYVASFGLDGAMRLEAQSIAFDSMEEEDFRKVFSDSLNVLIRVVLPKLDVSDQVRQGMMAELLEFDG
jgi:hypothetical protein